MSFDAIVDNLPLYLSGAWTTLRLLAMSLALGLLAAIPLGVMRVSSRRRWWLPVACFTFVVRGTPLLVQLFLLYYGLAQFESVRASLLWPLLSSAWFCAVAAFAINTCAYTTEIIAGAIRATPAGEVDAARSVGMPWTLMVRRILLPSALRRALPAYGNEVVLMLHATSLASIVTLLDLTGAARDVNSRFFLPFPAFVTAALFYLAITFALVALFRRAEARWTRHLRPRS
ncbi:MULTISPECIES: ABC transporter permease [unclassified Rhizobacter]|uniref:ABC transporter permease n=1 Tax=unclassified Rhizobacter TaxID=2640088 RepID=UPI0006F9F522|nr:MULTISPECIES: ABC transporter permease [unclassified Rhizobacter]KQU73411.1 amino acid ABC transporter permease [Rhizobacter sp. Root29]KQV98596.1 amino acid ABC transporter permease [Rhizobacter sp. Root1238]KRB04849.1 amino acid ABC transporter permease [Rhizobacter sp. Root16D2]